MRFKAQPLKHAEYDSVRQRSELLSQIWLCGYVLFVLFASIACAMPFLWGIAAFIDYESVRGRVVDLAGSSTLAMLLFSAVGLAVKQWAKWKVSHLR